MSGRVVHFELPFDDGERASEFYQNTFGSQIQALPEMEYRLVMSGPTGELGPTEAGYINGGMTQRQGPNMVPSVVVDVANIEDALASVAANGGRTVVERSPVGDMGFSANFEDTEGNLIGLWESAPA